MARMSAADDDVALIDESLKNDFDESEWQWQ